MAKKNRIWLLITILTMLFFLGGMVYFALQQGKLQIKTEQKVSYNYKNFAENNQYTTDGVIVLAYHRILKKTNVVNYARNISKNPQVQQYNVDQDEFIKQMVWLKKHHVSVWSTTEFINHVKNNTISGKHVVITFDDIDTTLPRNAAPIMYQLGLPFTTFVITGRTGTNMDGEQMATWSEIASLSAHKEVTIGLHTDNLHYQINNHPILSMTKVSTKKMIADYQRSYKKIDQHLAIKPNVFAYPYGSENKKLTTYMSKHGMAGIFLLEPGIVTNGMPNITNGIPRFVVTNTNFGALQKWLQ